MTYMQQATIEELMGRLADIAGDVVTSPELSYKYYRITRLHQVAEIKQVIEVLDNKLAKGEDHGTTG